ncbi:nesprin-2-like isoform X2 [Syngnathus scovelli]|uniref:nesprin-2-like isoform X2 n=1 Tax=Syngnathus scovelli TaxID=161590 RepID=UPI002110327D|nr:nesprin-2-like isoform X2 [Syngnathus scovelli]
MSTLKAKGYLQLENLSSCAENNRKYAKSLEGISLHARNAEASLEYFVSREAHSLNECTERLREHQVLRADLDSALRQLEEMEEWCPEQRCQAQRETSAAAAWTRVIKLCLGSRRLSVRLEQRIVEWSDIARSVEKASAVLRQTEEELPELAPLMASTKELVDLQQCWEQYRDRLDCEYGALCALEQRVARLLGIPDGTEEAPPTPLCQHLQAIRAAYGRVKQSSRDGLEQIKLELEDDKKLQEELQVVWVWLTKADSLLSQMDPSNGIVELKVLHGQLCVQKALVRGIRERLKSKYLESDVVPPEIHGRLQEVQKALEQVQAKVEEAMETSGPAHRIKAELLETQVGLRSVQEWLQDRSCNMADAKRAQKLVWHELKKWHSQVAALEADVRDHAPSLTQRLAVVQQLCVQLTERAEQKTALIGKTQSWLEEHREMITSSKSWMLESQAWLATPRTYTTSKCLSKHVTVLQTVLKDAAHIRNALESFSSVLEQMSQVVDVSAHWEQRAEADRQLAAVQNSFAESLLQMERAAAEVTAMETEAVKMETDVAEIKSLLCSPETLSSPKKKHLKMLERRTRSMRSSITDFQKAKLLLRLPEKTDKTLTVLRLINLLQTSLPDLEKIQALSIQQLPAQRARGESRQAMSLMELELPSSLEEREKSEESEESEESKVSQVREVSKASGATEQNCFENLSSLLESVTHPKDPEAMVNISTGSKSAAACQQRCSLC